MTIAKYNQDLIAKFDYVDELEFPKSLSTGFEEDDEDGWDDDDDDDD